MEVGNRKVRVSLRAEPETHLPKYGPPVPIGLFDLPRNDTLMIDIKRR